jgi:hypothetical protein
MLSYKVIGAIKFRKANGNQSLVSSATPSIGCSDVGGGREGCTRDVLDGILVYQEGEGSSEIGWRAMIDMRS